MTPSAVNLDIDASNIQSKSQKENKTMEFYAESKIERLQEKHLDGVAILETSCFSEPWSKHALMHLLTGENMGFVAIEKGKIAAYVGLVRALDEGEITNVATLPEFRRRGLAKDVVRALLHEAEAVGICRITLEVRTSNIAAKTLYESLGFRVCGLRKNFYSHPREDGEIMEILLHNSN